MIYFCCEDGRRALIRQAGQPLNGIDRLEVVDTEFDKPAKKSMRQKVLRVFFVNPPDDAAPFQLLTALQTSRFEVCLQGGERVTGIEVEQAVFKAATSSQEAHLEVTVSERGDYSTYTLRLCKPGACDQSDASLWALPGLDPRLASVDFSFKVECPSELDCQPACAGPPAQREEPELDYLSKDYNSFRQLIFDRLSLIAPEWKERNPADLGVTLVELLAYVGDYLSYRQDAVATEAYLGTARQRVSMRRHARLLNYAMHEGCNARAWVQVRLKAGSTADGVILPVNRSIESTDAEMLAAGTGFSTDAGKKTVLASDARELKRVIESHRPAVFEPMHDVYLHPEHNEMPFYNWEGTDCCLPKGAVKATLLGCFSKLAVGQFLVFKEEIGPHTGNIADADLNKRHVVKLTALALKTDTLTGARVTEIEWHEDDALPFPLCLSSVVGGKTIPDVSVALGNIVLADHGWTLPEADCVVFDEVMGTRDFISRSQLAGRDPAGVPAPNAVLSPVSEERCGHCDQQEAREVAARFRPRLSRAGLTHAESVPTGLESLPAARLRKREPRDAQPAVLLSDDMGNLWKPLRDLISSEATAREFVAEVENDGRARIRFGDDINGQQPAEETLFRARYRIGNGARGNVGEGAIVQIYAAEFLDPDSRQPIAATAADLVEGVTNPLPARGGTDAETMEEVRQYAPQAFKTPRRCVTPEDYARRAGELLDVQRAAATVRWTGSWRTIFLTVDRLGGRPVDKEFEDKLRLEIEPWRMAGHDLEINAPVYVSLELSIFVCVADGYFRSDVKVALLDAFSSRAWPDGGKGFFHPDNFTFGTPVYISAIYAAVHKVAGVRHVEVRRLRRQGETSGDKVPSGGALQVGSLEIVRLDNDPNFPDHGELKLELRGGR